MTASEVAYEWGTQEGDDEEWSTTVVVDHQVVTVPHTQDTARRAAREGYYYERKLIRRLGGGDVEIVAYEPALLDPPTDGDLLAERHGGVMLASLGEEGQWSIALGHIYPAEMAQAVTLQQKAIGSESVAYDRSEVSHHYAVRIEGWRGEDDDDWEIYWERDGKPVSSGTRKAFPITVVDNER